MALVGVLALVFLLFWIMKKFNARVSLSDSKNMKIKITRSSQIAYEEAMTDFIGDIRQFCTSRDAGFVSVCTDQPIEKVLFTELLKVGIMA